MKGTVIKYFEDKGFGFIETENKSSFFFHRNSFAEPHNIKLYDVVLFSPQKTKKGERAIDIQFVRRGTRPQVKYIDEYPSRMLYSRDGAFPGGFKVIQEVGNVWSEARGFANARNDLLNGASRLGANAVIITKEWETHHSETTVGGWLNIIGLLTRPSIGRIGYALSGGGTYRYRMAHFEGVAVIVSRKKRQE